MSISTEDAQERRKTPRLSHMQFASFIEFEAGTCDCLVSQVSETGARIEIAQSEELPDEFTLHLSGRILRRCQVVWRNDKVLGVVWNWHGDTSVLRAWRAIFRES